jgi:hypothetical protein
VPPSPSRKPIRLTRHAAGYLASRGFTAAEVEAAIRTAAWGLAELGRLDCHLDFPYHAVWNGRHYATRRVRPVFIEDPAEIVVITVYTYYF